MVQFADLIAYATRRKYEHGDDTYFDVIKDNFDTDGGTIHGLVHYVAGGRACDCPICTQKKARPMGSPLDRLP